MINLKQLKIGRRFFSTTTTRNTLVELLYDVASPYTHVQHVLLKRQIPDNWKTMELKLTPVSIAHIMKGSSNRPPAMVPAKAKYLNWEMEMLAEYHRIPFAMPLTFFEWVFERGTYKAQKFLTAMQKISPESHDHLVGVLYEKFFTKTNPANITDLEVVKNVAKEQAGIPEELVQKAAQMMDDDDDVKLTLKKNTDHAIELGGFGLPMTLIHGEKLQWVFGSDRLHLIGYLLGEANPPILR